MGYTKSKTNSILYKTAREKTVRNIEDETKTVQIPLNTVDTGRLESTDTVADLKDKALQLVSIQRLDEAKCNEERKMGTLRNNDVNINFRKERQNRNQIMPVERVSKECKSVDEGKGGGGLMMDRQKLISTRRTNIQLHITNFALVLLNRLLLQ